MASASSMPPIDQNLKRLLECSICLETFDDPRTLPCLHSFCKKCLENFVDGKDKDELNCPECRGHFTLNEGVARMTRNHFICNMVEVLSIQQQNKSIPCSNCEQASVGRCVTCELFMCAKCFKTHNDWPGFRDHLVLTMKELLKPENQSKIKKISKCTKHPKKQLKYFCNTCDELICRHCMDFDNDHKQHEFSPLEKAAENKRMDLKKNCEILEKAVDNSNKKTRVLNEDIQSLSNNFNMTKRLMNERKQQLLTKIQNAVDAKTNTMIENARQNFDVKKKNINQEIHKNEAFFKRVNVSAEMARSLLENGDDEEIVRSYKSVQESVGRATKTGCDQQSYHIDTSLSWSSNEIDKILRAEVKDILEDEDAQYAGKMMESQMWNQPSQNSRLELDITTGKIIGKIENVRRENPYSPYSKKSMLFDDDTEELDVKKPPTSSKENYGKTSQKLGEKNNWKMYLDNILPSGIEKKDETKTLGQPASHRETAPQPQRGKPQPRRKTKPALQTCETQLQTENPSSRTSQDGQQRPQQKYVTEKNRDCKKNQGQNNENMSPNTGPAAPRCREFQRTVSSTPFQRNASLQSNTAQPHSPGTQRTSLWRIWNDSSKSGTAQKHGHGMKTDRSGIVSIGPLGAEGYF